MNTISNTRVFSKLLIFFFAFGFIFPTVRVLLVGHETSNSFFEYFISSLPELVIFSILTYTVRQLVLSETKISLTYLDWILVAFIVSNVVLGFCLAGNLKLSIYGFRMSYFPMLFYFLVRFYDFKKEPLGKMLDGVFILVVILAVVGHILYFAMPDVMTAMIARTGGVVNEYFIVRMTSLFWTPVVFGTFATAGFLYFYYKAIVNDHWSNYIFMAVLWAGAVLSVARGAIIPLLLGFVLFSVVSFKLRVFLKSFFVLSGVLFLLAFYINTPSEFFHWFWSSSVETASLTKGVTRVDLWMKAFDDFMQVPFGHGLGMTGHTGARFLSRSHEEAAIFSTDGWFLKLADETGIWGLVSYLFFAMTFFMLFVKRIRQHKDPLLAFLLIFFIAFNIQSLVSNALDFYLFSNLFWMLIGVSVNQYYKTA